LNPKKVELYDKHIVKDKEREQTEHGCGCKQPDKIKLDGMASIYAIWDNIEVSDSDENQK
jgi:hypothetical protein